MTYDDWTVVRYGRRRDFRTRRRKGNLQGWVSRGMDRAPAPFGGQPLSRNPNWPVPPSGRSARYLGPQSRSYAAVTRGGTTPTASRPNTWNNRYQQDQRPYIQPSDPKFGQLVRKLHAVIKVLHHLQNVTHPRGGDQPRMIAQMVDTLASIIKPAYPTTPTQDLILGNAKNWGHNTMLILKDHYKDSLDKLLDSLPGELGKDWKTAFEVATRWAKRNLPRITQGVIDHAEALITACGGDLGVPEQPQANAQATVPVGPQVQQAPQGVQMGIQTDGDLLGDCQVQAPKSHTVATMTDATHGWSISPGDSEEPDQIGAESPPISVVPGEQRTQRRRISKNPFLERDDGPLQTIVSSPLTSVVSSSPKQGQSPDWFDSLMESVSDVRQDSFPALVPVGQNAGDQTGTPEPLSSTSSRWRHLMETDDASDSDPFANLFSTPKQAFRVREHIHSERKMIDWGLTVEKKWLFIGDSNLARFPEYSIPDLQIESYPGANFRHAQAILEKADNTLDVVVEKVVLSFGINSRTQLVKETAVKQLQGALRSAKRQFPFAEIWIPLINFSSSLPTREQSSLDLLNKHIFRNMPYIPLLEDSKFQTEEDEVHWTAETADAILQHWTTHLNLKSR